MRSPEAAHDHHRGSLREVATLAWPVILSQLSMTTALVRIQALDAIARNARFSDHDALVDPWHSVCTTTGCHDAQPIG